MSSETRLRAGRFYGRVVHERTATGLRFNETVYEPFARIPRHAHDRAYICFVRHGEYTERYGGRRRECGPQTLAFHPPGEEHAEHMHAAAVRSFNVELEDRWIDRLGASLGAPLPGESAPGDRVSWLASALYREFRAGADACRLERLTSDLLEELAAPSGPLLATSPSRRPWLERVRARIDADPAAPLRLTDLADEANVHPVHLAAEFRRRFGMSIGDYRRRLRIGRACRDLARSERPLASVASDVGYYDQPHFTRTFKRTTGFTPARYRALFRDE